MIDQNVPLYVIAFLFTLTLTVFIGRLIIPILKERAKQPIYGDGPSWHMSKSGTPTMGGLAFAFSVTVTLLLCALYNMLAGSRINAVSLLITGFYALANAFIGIIDDSTKLRHKQNEGLTPRVKLILQFILSALFLIARRALLEDGTSVSLFLGEIELGAIYYLFALTILVGITNCANLTDGIDGLASSVAFAIGISLFGISYGMNTNASFISAALAAGTLGFLVFNIHPARIFMGDTGSLFLGALIAALAFEMKNPLVAVISGGVYVIEGVSVILQVAYFKMTKKRLFKMAPLHHHLEKSGWDENKICISAIILTLILSSSLVLCVWR